MLGSILSQTELETWARWSSRSSIAHEIICIVETRNLFSDNDSIQVLSSSDRKPKPPGICTLPDVEYGRLARLVFYPLFPSNHRSDNRPQQPPRRFHARPSPLPLRIPRIPDGTRSRILRRPPLLEPSQPPPFVLPLDIKPNLPDLFFPLLVQPRRALARVFLVLFVRRASSPFPPLQPRDVVQKLI